jgi:hypothetical protein
MGGGATGRRHVRRSRAAGEIVFTFGWDEKDHLIPPGSTTPEISLHRRGQGASACARAGLPADASTTMATLGAPLERLSIVAM